MHQIGVGVLGPVFRSYDPDDDRLVAIKAFHLEVTPEQASTLAAALQEIVEAGLEHPSIVSPVGAGLSDGVPYLALEYVAAESLDVASRHYAPAAVGTALPFVVQLAEALDAAHAGGLCHGALHLRDVFVTPDLVRVTGFGVVSALDRIRLRGPLRRPYTAPEQIAGADWGAAADRFALAAIAYELLTGKRLAGTGERVAERLAEVGDVRDMTGLTALFAGALADTPHSRPASARLFADELAGALGWTEADTVRRALVGRDSETGVPAQHVSDDVPVIAGTGIPGRPSADVETTGTEEGALDMARPSDREDRPASALDWTERKLDHGESDELRGPEAYEPRPPGAPAAGEGGGRTVWGAAPDFARIDAVLELESDGVLEAAGPGETGRPSTADVGDLRPEAAAEGQGRELRIPPGDIGDNGDDVDNDDSDRTPPPIGARVTNPEGRAAAAPPTAGLPFDHLDPVARAGGGAGERDDDGNAGDPGDDGGSFAPDDDLSVVQARYRPVDDGADPPSDAPDSQAAGIYEAITLSDLERRLGEDGRDKADDAGDVPDDADWGAGRSARPEVNGTLLFESDGLGDDDESDDGHAPYRYDEDRLDTGVLEAGWSDRVRRLPVVPLVLIAAVVTVAAFAAGYGWVAGGDDIAVNEDATEPAAGGLAEAAVVPEPVESAPEPSREFSEATIGGSPPSEVPAEAGVETLPPPSPIAATEAEAEAPPTPVAPMPVAPRAPVAVPPRGAGRLLVRSTPPSVRVTVNGEARGTTPLALGDLSYGPYDIRFSLDGYESQEHRFVISSDEPIAAISAELAPVAERRIASLGVGSVFVDTRPRGVEVWLDRQLVGETPMLIPNVSTGTHEVEFRHAGYRDWATTVQVGSTAQTRVTASLDRAPR